MTKSRKLALRIFIHFETSNDINSPTFLDDLDELLKEHLEIAFNANADIENEFDSEHKSDFETWNDDNLQM